MIWMFIAGLWIGIGLSLVVFGLWAPPPPSDEDRR